jgi:tRNA(Ile)-lysidine synthase
MDHKNTSLDIIEKVRAYIDSQRLFPPRTPLLVAVSGGLDSVVAADLLIGMGYAVGIAHCNFGLRGQASDEDQAFVEQLALGRDLPFFTTRFDTEEHAGRSGLSVQEAARELRYHWLEEIRKANGFHFTVTAHHLNDNAETVLYNLVKNTGIRGLHGIPPKRDHIARPLLCLVREEIAAYAAENRIDYREDATNTSVKYSRNFLRIKVIPELESVNPKAVEAISGLSRKAAEAELLMQERIEQIRRKILHRTERYVELKFGYILQHAAGRTILFELLREFRFNEQQCGAVYEGLRLQPGAEYLSATHRLLKDRKSLFITALDSSFEAVRQYDKLPDQLLFNNFKIQVREVPADRVVMKQSSNYAYFDLDKIDMPLKIRYWKDGDYFYPFGMKKPHSDKVGKKKLSKFFKDEKIPVHEKETTPVLFAGNHLIWLVGLRTDHRFRVTEQTRRVLKMKIIKS